ncbi:MAG: 4-(cytidine 5'-diphospho)-2-C-methyl-D-erythritol kinase [Candidatus Rokubacteria bacterium]|nr:4-(cytidine 5'-diphospho)-2-C-methyl-D-erythritol kinase [Candidatus Rokubacteria bacterium]
MVRSSPSGPRSLVLRASAKVNLALEVLGRRPDGYHEIATVLQAIDLSDRLVLEDADGGIELRCDTPAIPTDRQNLAWRAADLLRRAAGVARGVRIRLWKRIPVAAGLGGGSSDGAAVLYGCNRLWRLGWDTARLATLATELGMDVPFFLRGGRALATGRGEILRPLPPAPGLTLVIVNPGVPLPTRERPRGRGRTALPGPRRAQGGPRQGGRPRLRHVRERPDRGRGRGVGAACPGDPGGPRTLALGELGGADAPGTGGRGAPGRAGVGRPGGRRDLGVAKR